MRPELLLLLLLSAALSSEATNPSPEDSTGLKFIIAFPEIIAFYHPDTAQNKIQITALHSDTTVTLATQAASKVETLGEGETREYQYDYVMELKRNSVSNKSLHITSTKNITVHAVFLKNSSVQSALVIPWHRLGTKYLLPPLPTIIGTTDIVNRAVTERGPFKVIIINTDQETTVTVEGEGTQEVLLQPKQVTQIDNENLASVTADHPVAVLFGHTCALRENCTCGLLYTMLLPAEEEKLKFYIPPVLAKEGETFVLSNGDSSKVEAFDPDSPMVETVGTAVLYRPGLLLTLIPETGFAACFVVTSIPNATNFAVIVVHKDQTDGIHIGNDPLENPEWQTLGGTDHVSTQVVLALGKNIIWHAYFKMIVYLYGNKGGVLFGNPAAVISNTPDFRGCVLVPGVVQVGEVAGSWQESVQYCSNNGLELVSFPSAELQRQIYNQVIQARNDLLEVWTGMRRSSLTGDWYWLSKELVSDTNWAEGEPGTVLEGQCVIMSLETGKDFSWSDEDCCKAAHPVCYRKPVLFPVL